MAFFSGSFSRHIGRLFPSARPAPTRRQPRLHRLSFESLEGRRLLAAGPAFSTASVTSLSQMSVSETTGEKPQSKLWTNDGHWFSVMPDSGGTWIWRLDNTTWNHVLKISSNTNTHADVLAEGNLTHILLMDGPQTQLVSAEYVSGGLGSYQLWSQRSTATSISLPSSDEAATIQMDSTGTLWLASDVTSTVEVRYSVYPYISFSAPITIGTGISSDDISVIAAMDGKIGVLWSNQNIDRFQFRTHQDGADPTAWSTTEIAAGQSAQNYGGGMADDHLHVAVGSDGTLYAAIKTSYDTSGQTLMGLLVRRPNGTWDPLYRVDTGGTRPIVILDEATNRLMVAFTTNTGTGSIVYRETALDSISFGARSTLISGSWNNVTSTKQNVSDDVVLMAANGQDSASKAASVRLTLTLPGPTPNQAPQVNAGSDQAIVLPNGATLNGIVTDDNQPNPVPTTQWTKVSGPGVVTFGNAAAKNTTATFSVDGTYVLRLTADDGEKTGFDELTIVVSPQGSPPATTDPVTASFQNGSGYSGTSDTMILSGSPTTNRGTASSLNVDGSPDVGALIKWDISTIPAGSQIQSASITLNITNTSVDTYEIYELKQNWTELGATWNRYAAGANWQSAGARGANDRGSTVLGSLKASATGKITVQLNAAGIAVVQKWLDNPQSNFGFILQDYTSASDGFDFDSREASNAANRPKLTVTYQAPAPAPVVNLAASQALSVDAGNDQSIQLPGVATLRATVTGGSTSNPPTTRWTMTSGPASVSFGNSQAKDTTASFTAAGTYVLRLTADNGNQTAFDELTVLVSAADLLATGL
jgi:hypothetical protein